MPKKKINAREARHVMTVDEFDALLVAYKEQNPKKYETKKAKGEFDRFRATLKGQPKKEEPKVEKPEPKEEKKEEPKKSKEKLTK